MKEKLTSKIGKWFIKKGNFSICIIDDEEVFFTPQMLELAAVSGFTKIERHFSCSSDLLSDLVSKPRDALILDIKGIVSPPVAYDGLGLASYIYKHTPTYVALTSAHSYQMGDFHKDYDRLISNRYLTALDFVSLLNNILEDFLDRKSAFYKRIMLRVGLAFAKKASLPSP